MLRYVVLIAFILCNFSNAIIAQNKPKADSLKKILVVSQCDSDRFNLLVRLSKYDVPFEGLSYAKEALDISKRNKFIRKQALAFECLSICHRKLGNYPEAIKASLEALRIYDQLGLYRKTASLQLQIGSHFTSDKNYPSATFYIKQALATFRTRHDTSNIALALINLGETYRLMERYDSSSVCFTECLLLNRFLKNNLIQGYALGNIGLVHASEKQYGKAKEELIQAIDLLNRLGDSYSVSVYQDQLGELFISEGAVKQGVDLLLASLEIAEKGNHKEQIRDISSDLSLFYEKQGRFEEALRYRKKYEAYHDSLVNIDNVRKVEQLHSQYLLDKKEANILVLEKENSNKRRLLFILLSGTILLIFFLVFLQQVLRQRKKALKKVSEQNVIIEKREREKALLLKELNHRVKNNLQMVAGLINIQAKQSANPALSNALEATRRRIDTLVLIHQKLYWDTEDMQVNLENYIGELVENLIFSFDRKVNLNLKLVPVYLHIDCVIPLGIVINELITNTLKHANSKDKPLDLNIGLSGEGQIIHLNIADNGVGLPVSFENRDGSMGLKLVNSLIKQLKGDISYSNHSGCVWSIILNLDNYKRN